jgi:1-acyl-sn-glycerol-3-phosphate acyltransferase
MTAPNLYAPARLACLVVLKIVWRLQVTGTENVPRDGALVVACNHVSNLDPVALGCAMPLPVRYMAKRQLFAMPILGPLITSLQAYSVDREGSALAAAPRSSPRWGRSPSSRPRSRGRAISGRSIGSA